MSLMVRILFSNLALANKSIAGRTRMAGRIPELKLERQATADVPFTAEELEKAMTRATIRPDNPMSGSMAIAAH